MTDTDTDRVPLTAETPQPAPGAELVILDIETTSLRRPFEARSGEVSEVGGIVRRWTGRRWQDEERTWWLPVTLNHADPESLRIQRFHDRHPQGERFRERPTGGPYLTQTEDFADELVAWVPSGATLVNLVPSFDDERLAAILAYYGHTRPWHYELADASILVAGVLAERARWLLAMNTPGTEEYAAGRAMWEASQPPWDTVEMGRALALAGTNAPGVEPPPEEDRHSGIGDCRWALRLWDAAFQSPTW